MICGRNVDAAAYRGIHPNLDLALEHITPEFLNSLGTERVELKGSEVYCTKFTYDTVPDDQTVFEAHRNYLDIHIMVEGFERVEVASPEELICDEEKPENDICFYHGQGRYSVVLSPGNFLVVFPDDAHKLKMMVGSPSTVTKAVFKVKISES